MKRLALLLCLIAAPCLAQVNQPANGSTPGGSAGGDLTGTYPNPNVSTIGGNAVRRVLCKITTTISNTGNTGTNTYLAGSACQIPAGTLGANSQVYITALFARTSGTGNCNPNIWEGASAGALTNLISGGNNNAVVQTLTGNLWNVNSLSSQNMVGGAYGSGFANGSTSIASTAVNTGTTAIFISASQNNSVSGDNCSLISETVEYIP